VLRAENYTATSPSAAASHQSAITILALAH